MSDSGGERGRSQVTRLVVVSNRLPVVVEKDPDGGHRLEPGSGGLVTALAPVLAERGGLWIGWPGSSVENGFDELLGEAGRDVGYRLVAQPLSEDDVENYYYGFANQVLWPVFHDLPGRALHEPRFWQSYRRVNDAFARTIAKHSTSDDFVWVHDYHLMLVASALRAHGIDRPLGFFLHTPFPPLDIFLRLPRRLEILRGLLAYDLIGVQTQRDRRNLIQCLRALVRNVRVRSSGSLSTVDLADGRRVRIGSFPISIDFKEFSDGARAPDVVESAERLRGQFRAPTLMLGVDRLDYTKGIPQRLSAFEYALERVPALRRRLTLIQVVVPSRRQLPEYDSLKRTIDRRIGEINGRFSEPGWTPVHYIYGSLERPELLAYYRASDIALVTPIKDGMNLVVKEFCAASPDKRALPVLSEFTGAASQMHRHALMVNPNDVEGTAAAIRQAVEMPAPERDRRAEALRRGVRRQDIFWWVNGFLEAALHRRVSDFPIIPGYVEQLDLAR
jgi:trehalose 6-phosphate synthase